jgi:hypothetical protein
LTDKKPALPSANQKAQEFLMEVDARPHAPLFHQALSRASYRCRHLPPDMQLGIGSDEPSAQKKTDNNWRRERDSNPAEGPLPGARTNAS